MFLYVKVAVLMAVAFYAGLLFGRHEERLTYRYPPKDAVVVDRESGHEQNPPSSFDPVPSSPAELRRLRMSLEAKIYGGPRSHVLPHARPLGRDELVQSYVGTDVFSRSYSRVFAGRQIGATELSGAFDELPGYKWKSLLFRHRGQRAARLFVFHQGHDGSPFAHARSNAIISRMLDDGYDVLVLCMPGMAWNRIENLRIKTWDGRGFLAGLHENHHGLFAMIDTGAGHFVKFFIAPVVSSIDFAVGEQAYDAILMAGHSGGGWTTTLAAALDVRIDHSISYAGTLPYFAKHKPKDLGDPEQYDSAFYRDFPYPVLYELASWGARKHRIHYQLYSTEDQCCFDRGSTATLEKYLSMRPHAPDRDLRVAVVDHINHDMLVDVFFDILNELQVQ
jgi:hypothetical protein